MVDQRSSCVAGWVVVLGLLGGLFALSPICRYRKNTFVRFYAWQAIYLGSSVLLLGWIPGFTLVVLGLWVWAVIGAFRGEIVSLPIIGRLASDRSCLP